jgi:hypothetical protein
MRQTLVSHCHDRQQSVCVHIAAGACLLHNADQLQRPARHCCHLPVRIFKLVQKIFDYIASKYIYIGDKANIFFMYRLKFNCENSFTNPPGRSSKTIFDNLSF